MNRKYKVAFPQMANYSIPITYLFNKILDVDIIEVPPITKNTIEVGTAQSPEFVCTPFKYTLGNFIESLDLGADVLIQAGGGCRYGYYSELQEQILKDLGYRFKMINFITAGKPNIKKIYKELRSIGKINLIRGIYYLIITRYMIFYMDIIDDYIRKNIGFELNAGEFNKLRTKFLKDIKSAKSLLHLAHIYRKYKTKFSQLKLNKPKHCLKVAIIGELYTIMEPFSNFDLEIELAKRGIEIIRYTNVEYLVFQKKRASKKMIKMSSYIENGMGADAADNIYRTEWLCKNNFDGIVHIKSTFCTPEISSMPIISKICSEYKIPVIFMSFDSNTSEVGIKTRLEAFCDMIEMRQKNE